MGTCQKWEFWDPIAHSQTQKPGGVKVRFLCLTSSSDDFEMHSPLRISVLCHPSGRGLEPREGRPGGMGFWGRDPGRGRRQQGCRKGSEGPGQYLGKGGKEGIWKAAARKHPMAKGDFRGFYE